MRMWGVNPRGMCNKHLLGEHVEMHMAAASDAMGKSMAGFIAQGIMDTALIQTRHNAIAREMQARGMQHRTPLHYTPAAPQGTLDPTQLIDLHRRCPACKKVYERFVRNGEPLDVAFIKAITAQFKRSSK